MSSTIASPTVASAAAITAMTTGVKTHNTRLCVDARGVPLTPLVDLFERSGKATGVVSSVEFAHATPAAFVAHNISRNNYEQIANEMLYDSACDVIILSGTRYHIDWTGPTYYLVPVEAGYDHWMEPTIPDLGGPPMGEIWHEVAPDYCIEWEVLDWEDNGDGVLSPCDIIWFADGPYHLQEIGLKDVG